MRNGFTLIEILLSTAIGATIVIVATITLSTLFQARVKMDTITTVEDTGLFISELIQATLRQSTRVVTPGRGQTSTSLSVSHADPARDPTVFDIASDIIQIQEGANTAEQLFPAPLSVSDVHFENLAPENTPSIIRYHFTLHATSTSGRSEYGHSKKFTGSTSLRL